MLPPCSWKQELPIAGTEANACCLKQITLFHPKDESSQNQIVPFSSGISLNFLELYPLPRIRFHWNVQLVQGRQSQAGFSLPAPSSPCAPYHSVRLGSWIPAPTWDVGPACVFECMGEEENKGATRRSVCVCVACEETSSVACPLHALQELWGSCWLLPQGLSPPAQKKEGDALQPSVLLLSRSEAADY